MTKESNPWLGCCEHRALHIELSEPIQHTLQCQKNWNKLNTCGLSCVRPTDAFGRLFFCGITNTRWQKRSSTEKGVERLFFYLGFVLRFQMLHLLLVSLRNRFIIQPLYYLLLQWHDRDFQIKTQCWAVRKGKTEGGLRPEGNSSETGSERTMLLLLSIHK